MVKSIISMACVLAILILGAIFEGFFVANNFQDFSSEINCLYQKIDEQTALPNDVLAVQKSWVQKKKYLHVFIPHNEIKEVDLWLSEAVILVRDEEWSDALSKIEVLGELAEQIPKTFLIRIDNIL
jgi:flagellar motor component MotA